MVTYTKPQQRKEEECERLTGKRGQIKFIEEEGSRSLFRLRGRTSRILHNSLRMG